MTTPVRVLVVDDHPIVIEGMAIVLGGSDDLVLVGSATLSSSAVSEARTLQPDVVLLDVRVDEVATADVVTSILHAAPQTTIVLFTADPTNPAIPAALRAGASGVLSKDIGAPALRTALMLAARGETFEGSVAAPSGWQDTEGFTPRELEVLRHVALGKTNQEIADELGLATSTVKTYWQSAREKLQVHTRAEAVGVAHRRGLLRL